MIITGFLYFTHIIENGNYTEEQWTQWMNEMTSDQRPIIKIHVSIYNRVLEILPPVYMNSGGFGFAEGMDYVIDFWHAGCYHFCRRSDRMNSSW